MRDPHSIIQSTRISEKGTALAEDRNQYIFEVDRDATKQEIRYAVEQIFKKTVTSVNTLNVKAKPKRLRWNQPGKKAGWKKAIITLKEGEKLDLV